MAYTRKEVTEAKTHLRAILKPGMTVYTILRHVSKSGMQRQIDVYAIVDNRPVYLSGWVAAALQWRRHQDGPIVVNGCGMDAGFHLIHELSYAVHPEVQCSYMSELHLYVPGDIRPGYTLRHEWL